MRIRASRVIVADSETVFQTIADIREFSKAIPQIKDYERLTDGPIGVGTRFCETREMRGRELKTELEITEFVPHEFVRMVADNSDTVWDTTFSIQSMPNASQLTILMHANSKRFAAKLRNACFKWMIKWGVERDIDFVKSHCEAAT